jgi:glutathione S-transferase
MSPFCTKVETYLRASKTPHTLGPANMPRAPRGKIPYIELDGTILTDSQLIIEELERRSQTPLDAGLTDHQLALARMVRRTLEEGTYFIGVRMRWTEDDAWPLVSAELKHMVPAALRLALPLIRRRVKKMLHGQGTGRRSRDEAVTLLSADWDAIARLLGDQPFLLGDSMRTVDCSVFAFLDGTLGFPLDTSHRRAVASHANLVAYRQRIREQLWSDLPAAPPG